MRRASWIGFAAAAVLVALQGIVIPGTDDGNPPSRFGKLTSRRWAYGQAYRREILRPVENPNPAPEPLPRRDHPFDVAVSGDGTKAYVSLLGTELWPGDSVAVVDIAKGEVARRIELRPAGESGPAASGPFRLAMHPGGRFLVVTNRFSNFASVIDTQTDAVVSEIPLDFYCMGVTFAADGRTAWIANRYLDQVLVLDIQAEGATFHASMREVGGMDEKAFFEKGGIAEVLQRGCGAAGCHDEARGGFVAGADARASFLSALPHIVPGRSGESRLLRSTVRSRDGGTADIMPLFRSHAKGTVVFAEPKTDADYQAVARWIDATQEGPGIPVGNPRSKPKVLALGTDGKFLFVGNTGTQDISIVNTRTGREVGAIYVQNVVNDLKIHRSDATGHDWLLVSTLGIGFGVGRERDAWGGESWDRANPAAQYTVWRDVNTGKVFPRAEQEVLGPFDAVDGTAAIKFRDIQNDLVAVDVGALEIPEAPPAKGLSYLLFANSYESHRGWVRYTSDTAESTYGDVKGDIAPDLMRVVGAMPEKMVFVGDRVFVTMQGTNEVQELRMNSEAPDPSDILVPVRTHATGLQPIGIAAGRPGTPSAGKLFVANFLGGTLSVIDTAAGTSTEVVVDPSVLRLPVPATNAERGEFFAHSALFSADRDTSCVSCHYLDMGDGRPWGVSQVVGQEYLSDTDTVGQLVIGGTMTVPQQRALYAIQPFFLEGTLSAFEPRSMIMEHCPADDFRGPGPQGDFTGIEAHQPSGVTNDVQSKMDASSATDAHLEERRDEMFRRLSLLYLGKSFTLRDFQRFVGEWQIREPRLLPNPFDQESASVKRGRKLFNDPQVGCVSCHPAPHFTRKDFPDNRQQTMPPLVTVTVRDGSFTLVGMDRLDAINGVKRDLEPWDVGRAEEKQVHYTTLQLRGIWDRPPVFLHNGMARSLREVLCVPGQPGLGWFKYEPLIAGVPERPGKREVGFNETWFYAAPGSRTKVFQKSGGRIGSDTHGGTSHLTPQQIDDLVHFMEAIE